ncbi:hypothetical protein V1L52_10725 [Treponema sp. HNW]|uniref:hypothetical protein n=1 Tax=Treponema sp. HNW TaxID=3116654 RepID=UPI003D0EABE8
MKNIKIPLRILFVFGMLFISYIATLLVGCAEPVGFPQSFRVYYSDNYSQLIADANYSGEVKVEGIQVITQQVSCGYAVIEMLAKWKNKSISEQSLLSQNNGKISTSLGSGFLNEMTKQFPEWEIIRCVNLPNTELLRQIYSSLEKGFPVPIEFAAKNTDGKWTLHFALVNGVDFPNNRIFVLNPYGYEETYTIDNFIKATRYECYENMEWYFYAGFHIGLFNKNTMYLLSSK